MDLEIYPVPVDSESAPARELMVLHNTTVAGSGVYRYSGSVPADKPSSQLTPRIIPPRRGLSISLELPLIAWQKYLGTSGQEERRAIHAGGGKGNSTKSRARPLGTAYEPLLM